MIHLIGGGPGAIRQMRSHLKAAVAAVGKTKPLVAYVGVASGDNPAFRQMLSAAFVGTGARLEPVRLVSPRASVERARQLLEKSDLIFMSGGDVEEGMRILEERQMVEPLQRLARAGKPFVGISAGAILLCRKWVRFPDDDDEKAEPFDCLGIARVCMDAHSEDDDWSELRVLLRVLDRQGEEGIGYGVPRRGCLVVEGAVSGDPKLEALGDAIARLKVVEGRVLHEPPLEAMPAI